ncbi:MAG: hypothetical protein K8S23_03660 [Candidatus Cloacimonetes bacterium]|nr:hypothetical protein [Candidatus Cloacimonadota bacterium]
MGKKNLVNNLTKFNYKFQENENEIIINSNFKLNIHVNFKDDKVDITSELVGWNFLTGLIHMKLENAIKYSLFGSLIIIVVLLFAKTLWGDYFPIFLYLFVNIWSVGFISFYNVKFENMKTRIYNWLKD